jgi:hypothetical protein
LIGTHEAFSTVSLSFLIRTAARLCVAVPKLCTFSLKLAVKHDFCRSKIRHFGDFILGNDAQNPAYEQVIDNYCGFGDSPRMSTSSMVESAQKKGVFGSTTFATCRDRDRGNADLIIVGWIYRD